ncbi:MAG: recombination-associated protein RdgC, partial [Chloroflexi bacterium]|nr:recombination-associated protein RdgC [Chloroflexota bacterium]
MWFRNLQIYRLTETFTPTADELHEALSDKAFKPCAGLDTHRIGWTTPLSKHGDLLVHATNGCFMLCMRREERILPATVIREAV